MAYSNHGQYYASLVSSFIYPDYERYVRLKLGEFFKLNISSEDKRVFIKVKFEYHDIIYKKPLPKEEYYLKLRFVLSNWNVMLGNEQYIPNTELSRNIVNKFQLKIFPNNIQRTMDSLQFSPSFLLENSNIKTDLADRNKYGVLYYKNMHMSDFNTFMNQMEEFRSFFTYIKSVMVPQLCKMWDESIDIILTKAKH